MGIGILSQSFPVLPLILSTASILIGVGLLLVFRRISLKLNDLADFVAIIALQASLLTESRLSPKQEERLQEVAARYTKRAGYASRLPRWLRWYGRFFGPDPDYLIDLPVYASRVLNDTARTSLATLGSLAIKALYGELVLTGDPKVDDEFLRLISAT